MHHVYEAIYDDQGCGGLSDGDARSVWIKGEIKIHKGARVPHRYASSLRADGACGASSQHADGECRALICFMAFRGRAARMLYRRLLRRFAISPDNQHSVNVCMTSIFWGFSLQQVKIILECRRLQDHGQYDLYELHL
jgi:hypothetical protein